MDSFTRTYLIFLGCVLLIAIPVIIIVIRQRNKTEAEKKAAREKRGMKMYNFYRSVPFLKLFVKKVYFEIKRVAATGEHEARLLTASIVTKAIIAACIVGLTGTIILDNIISIIICWVGAYMMLNHVLILQSNKHAKKLLGDFAAYVAMLREDYLRTGSIAESLGSAECPDSLTFAIDNIKNIIESSQPEYELNKFIQNTQCSYIKTLAMAATTISDKGDDSAEDGQSESVFVKALKCIEEDSYSELERLQGLDHAFSNEGLLAYIGGYPVICLLGIFGTKFIPIVMLSILSMLQAWYGGLIAQIANVMICFLCVKGFGTASKMMSFQGVKIDDRQHWVKKLLGVPILAKIAAKSAPKKIKKRKLEKLLKDSCSYKTVLDISMERNALAVIYFVFTIIACIVSTRYQKAYFTSSTASYSLMANDDLADYDDAYVLEKDNEFIAMLTEMSNGNRALKGYQIYNEEATAAWVKNIYTSLGDVQISDQASRLLKKYDNINGAYFKWWMTLLALAAGVLGFLQPQRDLRKVRLAQVRIEERDDFMQVQTLCMILASADCDVMETLDNLSKLSKLYKVRLLTCYLNYATDPEKELERLKSKVRMGTFKHLVKKLQLAVDAISLKEAFEGMEIERRHILEERRVENITSVAAKREKANLAVKTALMTTLLNTLLAPILVVGFQSLVDVIAQIQRTI